MSAETLPAVQAIPQPESIPVPETPLERFASHVEWVREQGDAYDTRPALWPTRLSKAGAVTGLIGGLTTTIAAGEFAEVAVDAAGAMAVVGLAAWGLNRLREGRVREAAIRRMDAGTGLAFNQRYELVRVKQGIGRKAEIVMLWHGPVNDPQFQEEKQQTTVPEALKEMAEMAEKCGVRSIAMSPELKAAAIPDGEDPKLPEITVAEWLQMIKGLHTSGRTKKEKLAYASPADWAKRAHNKVAYDQGTGVDAMLTQLEGLDPRHSAVRLGRDYAADRDWQRAKVKASLKATLELQLGGTSISGAGDRHSSESFLRHEKQHGVALIDGEDVAIFVGGQLTERTPIIHKLGLTEERLELLLKSKKPSLRRDRQEALEFALYRTLHRQDDAQAADGQMGREIRDVPPMGPVHRYQIDLAARRASAGESTSRWPQRRHALALAAGAGAIMAVIAGSGMVYGDARYNRVHDATAVQLAHEKGLASASDVTEKQIRERMGAINGINTGWGDWKDFREGVRHDIWDTPPEPYDAAQRKAGFASSVSPIGNFGAHNPTSVWNVEGHKMSTDGMYVSDTWKTAVSCPPSFRLADICVGGNANWIHDPDDLVRAQPLPLPARITADRAADPYAKWIHVSGTVYRSDFEKGTFDAYMGLPMLPNSDLFAVNFNGQPVQIVSRQDGTDAIELKHPDKDMASGAAAVEYWFQPDDNNNIHQYIVKGLGDTTASSFYQYDANTGKPLPDGEATAGLDDIFKQYVPGYDPKASPEERRQAVYDYLKNDFLYTLNPISPDEAKQITSWKTFVANVLQRKIASCNIDTIILALADPRLGAASGFDNGAGDGSNVLTRDEAHIVNLDGNTLIDAVPTGQAQMETPGSKKPQEPLTPWLFLLAAMQTGGIVLLTQKQARALVKRQVATHQVRAANGAEKKLEAMGPFVLNLAAEAASAAAWPADGTMDGMHAINQAKAKAPEGYSAARARLADPIFRDSDTLKRLKQQPWAGPAIKQVYRQANIAAKRPPHHRTRK